jgi:membrane associated rhomboid family serine protease
MFAVREPFVVWLVVAACFAIFLALALSGSEATREAHALLRLEPGLAHPWSLLTYAFLHLPGQAQHVTLNMIFFLASAAVGGLASLVAKSLFELPFATVGSSAAIAGCAGLSLTLGLWFSSRHGRIPLRYVAGTLGGSLVLVSNLLIAMASGGGGVDHAAHVGGLLFGIATAYLSMPSLAARAERRYGAFQGASSLTRARDLKAP